jgi:fucose 4-O-acetylase-like acetyltransferase
MPSTQRDPWLDNAKMVLVTLVVVGHSLVLVPLTDTTAHVYDFIYYLHIPAFVLVTGYLSKSFRWTRRHLAALLTTVVVPYVVFEGAMAWFRINVVHEQGIERLWLDPHWPMWFLAALAIWRLTTPILKAHWLMIPASVAVSLTAGVVDIDVLDLSRVLGLLPFFVIGLHLTPARIEAARAPGSWVLGVLILLGIWQIAGRTDDWISTQWVYFRTSYEELGVAGSDGAVRRLLLILIALAGTFAVLSLIPRGRSWLSTMGKQTLVVYLCHGFAIQYAEYRGYLDLLPSHPDLLLWVTMLMAVGMAMLLASEPVAGVLTWVVDPVGSVQRARRKPSSSPAPSETAVSRQIAAASAGPRQG